MNFVERGQPSGIYPLTEGNLKDILTTLSQEEKETLFKEIASASLFSRKLPAEPNQRIISQIISFLEGKEGEGNLKDILTTLSQEEKETLAHLYHKEEVLFPLTGENRENSEKIALGQEEILFSVKQREELANQILEKINLLRAQNHNEARIVLRPKSLGDVHLHLSMHKNNLTLQIEVFSQKTAEIIGSDFTYLEETLKKEGLILKEFTVSLNQNSDFDRFEGQMKNPFYSSKKTLFPKTNVWSEERTYEEKARSQVRISSGFYYIDYLV